MREDASKLSRMITLNDEQRAELMKIVSGTSRGSYVAALTLLHLADGKSLADIARITFSGPEENSRIKEAFKDEGLEAVRYFEPD